VRGSCPPQDPICSVTSFRNLQAQVPCRHYLRYGRCRDSQDLDCRTIEPAQRRTCRCSLTPWRSPSRSVRLYRRFGLDLRDIGVGTAPGCANIVACSIDLDPAAFHKLQCDPVTLLNSITRFGQLPLAEPGMPGHSHPTEASAPVATCPSQFGTTERYTRKQQSRRPAPDISACLQGGNGAGCRPPSPSPA
jgi:hypothetical protein